MGGGGERPPRSEGDLSSTRCPSCGALLQFEAGRAEGFCQIEGIYVEVLAAPSPPAQRPPLVRAEVLAATKRELQQLCRAYGLRLSGNKTDLLTRLLRYMDDHGIDPPPEEVLEAGEPAPAPEPPPMKAAPELDRLLSQAERLVEETAPAASAVAPVPGTADSPLAEELEPIEETEPIADVEPEAPAAPRVEPPPRIPETGFLEEATETAAAKRPARPSASRLRRDRRVFYTGSALASVGLAGLLLGAILHDALRIPLFGTSYAAFGPLNVTASLLGGILLAAGIAGIGFGLRGGVVPRERPSGG